MDLAEQPVPEETRCPDCGGEPLDEEVLHRLSTLGYAHDDLGLVCEDCGNRWTCGVPIGEFDRPAMAGELRCDSCEAHTMLIHRVERNPRGVPGDIGLHLKCPNPECRYFTIVGRESDGDGIALTGYAELAGQTEGADPYGWTDDSPPDTRDDVGAERVEMPPRGGDE